MDARNTFARKMQELEVVDERKSCPYIRLIAVASAVTLERVTQVAVVGIRGDIRLLIGRNDIEAFGSIARIVRSDERRGGIIHQDYILQSLLLTEGDDGFA